MKHWWVTALVLVALLVATWGWLANRSETATSNNAPATISSLQTQVAFYQGLSPVATALTDLRSLFAITPEAAYWNVSAKGVEFHTSIVPTVHGTPRPKETLTVPGKKFVVVHLVVTNISSQPLRPFDRMVVLHLRDTDGNTHGEDFLVGGYEELKPEHPYQPNESREVVCTYSIPQEAQPESLSTSDGSIVVKL